MTKRFSVRGMATSTLDVYSDEDWSGKDGFGDPNLHSVTEAWRAGGKKSLLVTSGTVERVVDGLTVLSNTEDEIAEQERRTAKHRRDVERMRHSRSASNGLSSLAICIARAFQQEHA